MCGTYDCINWDMVRYSHQSHAQEQRYIHGPRHADTTSALLKHIGLVETNGTLDQHCERVRKSATTKKKTRTLLQAGGICHLLTILSRNAGQDKCNDTSNNRRRHACAGLLRTSTVQSDALELSGKRDYIWLHAPVSLQGNNEKGLKRHLCRNAPLATPTSSFRGKKSKQGCRGIPSHQHQ